VYFCRFAIGIFLCNFDCVCSSIAFPVLPHGVIQSIHTGNYTLGVVYGRPLLIKTGSFDSWTDE